MQDPYPIAYNFHTRGYLKSHCFSNPSPDLQVQEFDDILQKEITKRYEIHEVQRLSKSKNGKNRERKRGAGRHFKLDIENRFLMILNVTIVYT